MNGPTLYAARHGLARAIFLSAVLATAPTATAQTLPMGVPDFCAAHTITSVSSGPWSNPATWSPGRVPAGGDVVRIAAGTTVSYDALADASIACVGVEGALRFRSDTHTRLRVGTLLVKPSGELTVGTPASPIAPSASAEIVIVSQPLNTSIDPSQYGTGLIGLGKVTMHGAARTPTFTRLASEPRTGQTTLTLAGPVSGWRVGDRIVLPDTRQLAANERFAKIQPQFEDFTITGLSGTQVTLNRGMTYNHDGARNAQGVLEFLPHIGNLSRNVVIRSDNPAGTRGHTIYIHQAAVDIRYVLFKDLGRTTNATLGPSNMIGRYPLHIHHVMGPANPTNTGYQFTLIGNAIADSRKWPLTVHNSHYGLIRDNVVFNGEGAGFITEDGNESYNEFVHNFGVAIFGDAVPRNQDGRDASIFWFKGFNHVVRDNVAANGVNHHQDIVNGSGFNFTWPAASRADTRIPLFRGADVTMTGEYRLVNMQLLPIPEFSGNEAYGAMPTGVVAWQLGTDGYQVPSGGMGETIFRNFTAWHLHESAYFGYPSNNVTLEGLVVRGHPRARGPNDGGSAWYSNDYKNRNVTIRHADIQGMSGGLELSTATEGSVVIEDSYFSNWRANISVDTLATPGTGATPLPRTVIIRNTRFDPMPGAPSFTTINMNWSTQRGNSHTQTSDRLFVYSYNGIAGSDFRVFYPQQASQSIAGGTATCTTKRTEVDGLVCPITVRAPAPAAISPTAGPASGGTTVTITGANFAAGVRVEFGGIPATNVTVESATRMTATTPATSEGLANVSVTNSEGQRGFLVEAFNFGNGNAPPCRYALDSSAAAVPASGGSRGVSVSAGSGCGWTAVSKESWITVTAGSSGSGKGMVEFAVAANPATGLRSGTLSIAGETFTVNQDGAKCSYTVSPTTHMLAAGSASDSVNVTTASGCSWTATSQATWIAIENAPGGGSGVATFKVAANTSSSSRTGMLTVAGQTVTVTQAGAAACTFVVSPTTEMAPARGGAATVTVTARAGCGWTAISNVPWIAVTSTPNGSGDGTVKYTVDPHTGSSARTGTLTVAGQTVTVTQQGQAPPAGTGRTIGIDFVGSGTAMGPAESAGLIAKANWNSATGATRRTALALTDDTRTATGATVTWSADNVWSTPIGDQAGNRRLMKGYLDTGFGRATTITVAGLADGAYDVYVYVDGDNGSASRTGVYRLSGSTTAATVNLTDTPNANFNGAFSEASNSSGNYVKFSITGRGFTLTATPGQASTGIVRAPVNAIQIVAR